MPKKPSPAKEKKITELPPHKRGIKIRKLKLKNFKAFDEFEIDFPEPEMEGDPDIIVIGSENGVGKTSILEAISLVFLYLGVYHLNKEKLLLPEQNFGNLLVRSGSQETDIYVDFSIDNNHFGLDLTMDKEGFWASKIEWHTFDHLFFKNYISILNGLGIVDVEQFFNILLGRSHFPLILPGIIYFHSYRKVKEGSMAPNDLFRKKTNLFVNFKEKIVKSYFPKMGSFEKPKEQEEQKELFNSLLNEFASVSYKTPVETPEGRIDIPVYPLDGRQPFDFDGLSSGQKEIVSMIYLMKQYAPKNSIVLIDEPELHLNAGWHRPFIHRLHKLMPENQYIIATHSEAVFKSVDPNRRRLLIADKKKNGKH